MKLPNNRILTSGIATLLAISATLTAPRAHAAPLYWDNSGGTANDWGSVANWSTVIGGGTNPGAIPGTGDVATFSATSITTAQTVNLNGARSVLGLDFLGTTTTTTALLGGSANQTLTLGASGITIGAGAGAVTIGSGTANQNVAITLGAAQSWTNNASTTLTAVNGLNLATFALTKAGTGALTLSGVVSGTTAAGSTALNITNGTATLSGANTFRGNIAVSGSGVFAMAGNTFTTTAPYGASGTANVYKQLLLTNGGTFRLNSGTFNNNGTATNQAAGIIFNFGTGGGTLDVASGANLTIDDGTGTGTAGTASQIQGTGTITKTGLGIFQQDDSTAFAGAIIIAAGTFQPASPNAGGATSAGTTIQSGAQYNVNGVTMTNAEPLTINGTGLAAAPAGALTNSTGTGTYVGPITLGSDATIGGGAGALTLSSGATVNIGANTLTLNQGAGRTTFNSVISGTGAVVVTGTGLAGDWANSAVHTYSGGTTLNAGSQTVVGANSVGVGVGVTGGAFGTGNLVLNGGAVRSGIGAPFTVGNTVTLQADTLFYTVATEKNLTFTGPVTLTGGNRTLTSTVGTTVPNTVVTFSGAIGDGGNALGLIKAGAGNLVLGGANTYTGATVVNAGALGVTGSLANNTALTVAGGATFSLTSNTANPLNSISALNLGTAALTTTLGLDLGTTSDTLATAGAATTAGTVNFAINALSGFGSSPTYTLVSALSGLSGATYSLTSVPGGYTYSLTPTDTSVVLNATAAATGNVFWRGAVNNSWSAYSAGTTNWTTDAAGATNAGFNPGSANTVVFSATAATGPAFATTLDNNFAVRDLQFTAAPAGVSSVSIAPGTPIVPGVANALTIAPASALTGISLAQGAGAVTISAPVVIGAAQTWSVDSSTPGAGTASSLTVSGPISGGPAATLTFASTAGTAPIILSGASSTFSGGSTVSTGAIVQGGATNGFSPNTAWTVDGTLNTGAFNQATGSLVGGSGTVQNGSATNATMTIGSDNLVSANFGGTIQNGSTGTLGITKAGTGLQILSGTNTYTGTTSVANGTLRLDSALASTAAAVSGGTLQAAGNLATTTAVTLSGAGILDLFGASQTVASMANVAGNTLTNSSASTAASTATTAGTPAGAGVYVDALTISAAAPTFPLLITDGATRKTQLVTNNNNTNTGLMGFTNGALNTFSGGLVLAHNTGNGTRLSVNAAVTGTPFGTGPIIVGQSETDRAGIFFSAAGNNFSLPIVVNTGLGTDRFGIRNDGQTITLSGLITANTDVVFSSNGSAASNTIITNKVTGVGGLAIDLSQTSTANTLHTVTLNTAANTNDYAGDTIVGRTNAVPAQNYTATLALGASDQIPNGAGKGNVILNNNSGTRTGNLNLAGFSDTINGLSGNGTVEGGSGTPTLTLGDNNATATFSGIIQNTAGTLALTKIGTGTQTLSGASTFAGPITVNGGLIAFASSPATTGPLGNSTTVNLDGGGLSYTATGPNALNRSVNIASGTGTINVASSAGVLTVGALTSGIL